MTQHKVGGAAIGQKPMVDAKGLKRFQSVLERIPSESEGVKVVRRMKIRLP